MVTAQSRWRSRASKKEFGSKIMGRLRRFIINQPGSERQEVLAVLMEGKMNMRRLSEADLPGVKRAGGAEDKGSAGTRTQEAQFDQMRR